MLNLNIVAVCAILGNEEIKPMSAISEVKAFHVQAKKEGSLRSHVPPRPEERFYSPLESAPRKKLEEIRDWRLRHIVNWAYRKSPFYRKLWDEAGVEVEDIKGYDDLEKLPVWRKEQQRQDEAEYPPFGSLAVKELVPYVPRLFRSTGTTGKPTTYLWVKEEFDFVAEVTARWFHSCGFRPGGAYIEFAPQARGQAAPTLEAAVKNLGMVYYVEEIGGFQADPVASCHFQIELAKHYKSLATFMAPEFLVTLGRQFEQMGIECPYDVLAPGGTPLTPGMRRELVGLYPKVRGFVNIIGGLDGGRNFECLLSATKGLNWLHENEDLVIYEVVKPGTNERAGPGERGELVFTNLCNHTQPFIRFSSGDVFSNSFTLESCECGRTTKRWLEPCPGRLKDVFQVRGCQLLPWDVEVVIGDIPETTLNFQVILDNWNMDRLHVKVETHRALPAPNYEQIVASILEERLKLPVVAEVVPAGSLLPPAGKWKMAKVVDHRPKR